MTSYLRGVVLGSGGVRAVLVACVGTTAATSAAAAAAAAVAAGAAEAVVVAETVT